MNILYYTLNEMLKTYRVFNSFDKSRAKALLEKINELRLSIALIAEQREIFISQINVQANASGYKNDVFYTSDDIKALISRFVAFLSQTVVISLTQQGIRENIFTRQSVPYQQIFSAVQTSNTGQNIPFDLPQEIYLDKSESLDIGVTNQTTNGFIFVHGCNLKDDYSPRIDELKAEINRVDENGNPILPQMALVPIQFVFPSAVLNTKAKAVDGGSQIFSIKNQQTIILHDVSTTSINSRITLIDNARNQEICNEVESLGIAGFYTNQYTVYYPLPYPHILRSLDRLELKALNGSLITGAQDNANDIQTLIGRGWTI